MENLIPIVNKLQDIFSVIGQNCIELPQITVVGSQSSGKSSVLESLVGRDFLPRGNGICTRRPLVLQLYTIDINNGNENELEEWGEFLHLPGQKFYDFSEIRAEIQRDTDRVTGKNKGLSNKTINLKIYSPHVLNLTLVDLPGITKVPTGDQPEDVEEQIRSMCYEFTSNPNAIILAVSAANQDLVNSDGLKMARAVDPEGYRTIGVLTKVDIMDQGTDCSEILSNKLIPLRKGYIAVVNRSQKEIQENVPIRKGLEKEQLFFQTHPRYRHMLSKCGTMNLARSLNQILMRHIKDNLPEIKSKIGAMMLEVNTAIAGLGDSVDVASGSSRIGGTLLNILAKLCLNITSAIEGRSSKDTPIDLSELRGGARIKFIFTEIFGKKLKEMDAFEGLSDDDIRTAIANANGTRHSLFGVPELSFDILIRTQISKLEKPGIQCVDLIFEEMQRICNQSDGTELSRFPDLKDRIFEIIQQLLRDYMIPTQKMISNLIQVELAYINISHPDFIGGKQAVANIQNRMKQNMGPTQTSMNSSETMTAMSPTPKITAIATATAISPVPNSNSNVTVTHQMTSMNQNQTLYSQQQQQPSGFLGWFKPGVNNESTSSSIQSRTSTISQDRSRDFNANSTNSNSYTNNLPPVPERMKIASPSDRDLVETEVVKLLLSSYFDIVKKNFMDLVPKTIMHFLVNVFKDNLQNTLVSELYRENLLAELMRETEDIAEKRKSCREMKELLQKALEILNEVKDFNNFT